MEPADPPPKKYALKAREFVRLNEPPASTEPTNTFPTENDVHAILRHNQSIAQKHGLNEVIIKDVKSRRKRDYWLILIGGNLLIVGGVALGRFNPISLIFGLSGVVMLSLALTWIMWFLIDDY